MKYLLLVLCLCLVSCNTKQAITLEDVGKNIVSSEAIITTDSLQYSTCLQFIWLPSDPTTSYSTIALDVTTCVDVHEFLDLIRDTEAVLYFKGIYDGENYILQLSEDDI